MELPLERQEGYRAAASETEKKLVEIWAEVLKTGRENISVTANFFESGGHSLNATVLVAKIFKQFNIEIPLRQIFDMNTIVRVAERIENERWIRKETPEETSPEEASLQEEVTL
jgi:acyl carrier protein